MQATQLEIRQAVLNLFQQYFPAALHHPHDAYFVETGALDSFAIVDLVARVEELLHCKIPDEDITENNFGSVAGLMAYVLASHEAQT